MGRLMRGDGRGGEEEGEGGRALVVGVRVCGGTHW